MELLSVQNLCKNYSAFQLKEVSFAVQQGHIMGFIGKNGAGKSTTLKSILHMVCPDSGTIKILGKEFEKNETYCKQNIGVVLGGIDFYPKKKLKVITNVTKRFYQQWSETYYKKYLQLFELDEEKKVEELSSGMKVKYLITLALSHQAKLLIFDEPTSGLDPVSRDDLLELFQALVKQGERSILFSTHITSDLEKCADDITYIKNGQIIASKNKKAFIESFQYLSQNKEEHNLTLEEIMIGMERREYNETFDL